VCGGPIHFHESGNIVPTDVAEKSAVQVLGFVHNISILMSTCTSIVKLFFFNRYYNYSGQGKGNCIITARVRKLGS